MKFNKVIIIILVFLFSLEITAQEDSTKIYKPLLNPKKPGGIFISPIIGAEFPTRGFVANSKYALCIGGKLEYSSLSIYPFVIGATVQYQNHPGADDFKTIYLLNSLSTKITSYGASIDLLLNKYLKSSFTIPFVFLEARMLNIKREASPESNYPNLKSTDNTIGFGIGGGFTLYIFDIYGTYFSAKEYSTISVKMRFRFPLIKF